MAGRNQSISDDDDETALSTRNSISQHPDLRTSSMKPKFDAMLRDIESNLPSLDDEDSDFEVGI